LCFRSPLNLLAGKRRRMGRGAKNVIRRDDRLLANGRPGLLRPAAHGRRQWAPDSSSDPPVQRPARVALAKEHWNKLIRLRRITGAGHPELSRRSSGTRGEPGRPPGPA
jgi:hypothetical protein